LRWFAFAPFLALSLSSTASAGGVIVGTPVDVVAAPGSGLTFTSLSLPISTITVDFCGLGTEQFDVDAVLALGDPLLLPAGELCGLSVALSGTTVFTGTGTGGGSFELDLDLAVIEIPLDPSVTVTSSSGPSLLELASADWVTASSLELGPSVNRVVNSTSTEHPALRAAVRNDSTVQ
jgi:hypothetical protein